MTEEQALFAVAVMDSVKQFQQFVPHAVRAEWESLVKLSAKHGPDTARALWLREYVHQIAPRPAAKAKGGNQ
jgi:hypothetical protein